ncbi:hypothetical protein RN2511_036020 [Rhodococcus sp. NKCM2511]|nr:hypothetical protein RN2511_036020 [Rhodococcus sp. NKCM2511]
MADVVFDGYDSSGQPVGRPWNTLRSPFNIQMSAVSKAQVDNSWDPLLEMLRLGPAIGNHPGLDPMESFVQVPGGRIIPVTASPR